MEHEYLITENPVDPEGPVKFERLSLERLISAPPENARGFWVDASDPEYCQKSVFALRRHSVPSSYLKPLILILSRHRPADHILQRADAHLSFQDINSFAYGNLRDVMDAINRRILSLPDYDHVPDTHIGFKMIRYLYVRSKILSPVMTAESRFGFLYPEVETFLPQADESIFQVLDFLESQSLLTGRFHDRGHFCNRCHSAFINFRETCPHCKSADLAVQDLIHHFRCAYVGEEEEFRRGENLVCPKCEKILRHIGVDYDKPSNVHSCHSCGQTTQEPEVDTACFFCGKKGPPEDLVLKVIKSYSLTALGENAAIFGLENLFRNIIEKELPIPPYESFKLMLTIEIERIKRYHKSESTLCLFQIADLEKIYLRLGSKAGEIFGELCRIIKAVLRSSDIITSLTDSTFLAVMIETPVKGAEMALSRLKQSVNKLLEANFNMHAEVRSAILPVQPAESADELIRKITENVNHS
jgi:GGDEF domain-containing protein